MTRSKVQQDLSGGEIRRLMVESQQDQDQDQNRGSAHSAQALGSVSLLLVLIQSVLSRT